MPRDQAQETPLDEPIPAADLSERRRGAPPQPSRRAFLGGLGVAGLTAGAVACSPTADGPTDLDDIAAAERLAGLQFDDADRELMLDDVVELRGGFERLREVSLDNSVPPSLGFEPGRLVPDTAPSATPPASRDVRPISASDAPTLDGDDELAFASIRGVASLLRSGELTSRRLTELYLDRLDRFDPQLECVITRTTERALAAADVADRELAEGAARGPLHGIPWGAKDLLAVRDYPTTWGATPFRDQVIDQDAAVVEQLDRAGAVLIAKLTLGALAWGDVWFDGTTRNPWNLEQGSSGSSAGSASATAAGLAGFTIGSETLGSIVSPCTRCGATGLRPSFGRVSRHGAMAL
ncbi:MAG: amidase, partial [Acidobacteriota bacterium]